MVSIGDSKMHILLRCQAECQAEYVLLLLRGSLYLLITCHMCSPVQGCATYSDLLNKPQLKCAHAAQRARRHRAFFKCKTSQLQSGTRAFKMPVLNRTG